MLEMIIVDMIIMIAGIVCCTKPEWVWMITESWKSDRTSEPSGAYVKWLKINGMIIIVIGVLLLFTIIRL